MEAIIDKDICTGCGLCVDTSAEVFEMKDDVAIVKANPVPAEAEDSCREAKDACPVEAISIEE